MTTPQISRASEISSIRARSASRSRLEGPSTSRAQSPNDTSMGEVTARAVLGRDASVAFFRAATQCQMLRVLDLRSSQLSSAAVHRLARLVRGDQLSVLSLADCFIGAAIEPLLDAVSVCRRLVQLNLRLNAISGNAGIELCRALDASVSLTEVDLTSNELNDSFGEALAAVLTSNEVLWKLDLIRNPLGARTGDALLQSFQMRNTTLITIGDTVNHLLGLGLRNRFQIQCLLDANKKGLELGARPGDDTKRMGISLEDFEWRIIEDEPPLFEPLVALL